MKRNQVIGLLLITVCVIFFALVSGCAFTRPDPETGIKVWIAAVNSHDYNRVYDLAPQSIRQQINRSEFIAGQRDNPLLAPGNVIKSYNIMNKTVSANDSAITAQLTLHLPARGNQTEQDIPLFIKFVEVFEKGEWHVWTTAPI